MQCSPSGIKTDVSGNPSISSFSLLAFIMHAHPLLNNSGTANREVTHSVPSTNRIDSSPLHIARKSPKVYPPSYSLPPNRLLQLSSQPIRKLRAHHPGLSSLSGYIHRFVMGRRNAPQAQRGEWPSGSVSHFDNTGPGLNLRSGKGRISLLSLQWVNKRVPSLLGD
ncbi:hypothetical protein TNCV_2814321 [Trichonephila clavipes]|nr:hypothetical protein TNCV_2814321 [Trichonephila clavipes]